MEKVKETRSKKKETRSKKKETRSKKKETRSKKKETRNLQILNYEEMYIKLEKHRNSIPILYLVILLFTFTVLTIFSKSVYSQDIDFAQYPELARQLKDKYSKLWGIAKLFIGNLEAELISEPDHQT